MSDDELRNLLTSHTALKLEEVPIPGTAMKIFCDVSKSPPRPYVPRPYRRHIFTTIHGLSHPGTNASVRLITDRFVWPSVRKDCREWARTCQQCQRSKVTRHNKTPIGNFDVQTGRFQCVHIDLVGPLPPANGYRYCLTAIDRFSRWPEAVPLREITAEKVALAFLSSWIARFGCPLQVTTDQGRQFESTLFHSLAKLCGIKLTRTTAYHPQSNGMVERFHRTMKAALMAHHGSSWYEALPVVLLGLRTTYKTSLQASTAEVVYGEPLRVPGEFFKPDRDDGAPEVVKQLRACMANLRPAPASRHCNPPVLVAKELTQASHVFLRRGEKNSLMAPYTGPYQVVRRTDKTVSILVGTKERTVSIDRVKSAYLLQEDCSEEPVVRESEEPIPGSHREHSVTKSGRRVRFPDRYEAV